MLYWKRKSDFEAPHRVIFEASKGEVPGSGGRFESVGNVEMPSPAPAALESVAAGQRERVDLARITLDAALPKTAPKPAISPAAPSAQVLAPPPVQAEVAETKAANGLLGLLEKSSEATAQITSRIVDQLDKALIAVAAVFGLKMKPGELLSSLEKSENEDFFTKKVPPKGSVKPRDGAKMGVVEGGSSESEAPVQARQLENLKFDLNKYSGRAESLRGNWNVNGKKYSWGEQVEKTGNLAGNAGVSKGLILAIGAQESGLDPNVATQESGDTGPFQFIKRFAWTELVEAHPKKYSLEDFERQAKDKTKATEACFDYVKILANKIKADPKNPNDFARIYAAYNKGWPTLLQLEKDNPRYADEKHPSAKVVAEFAKEIDGLTKSKNIQSAPAVAPVETKNMLTFSGFPFAFPKNTEPVRTSPYGLRDLNRDGELEMHHGQDIALPDGTRFYANDEMTVVNKGTQGGKGNFIELRLKNGNKLEVFHLQKPSTLSVSQELNPGDFIGYVGQTGHATGPHLHVELSDSDGKELNPSAMSSRIPHR